jgi:alpha-amylase
MQDEAGKASGLLGWWPGRTVTFVDNHDTGSSQQHWPFPADLVGAGYAYILSHPGVPCIFWEHYFDWGSELRAQIDALLQARKRQGIVASSELKIKCAEGDLYVAEVGEGLLVKLGGRFDMGDHAPSKEEWKKVVSGHHFCVWERV